MAEKTPIRGAYSGASLTGLAEYASSDVVGVAFGGTGATSLTDNGVLIGNTTSAIQVTSALTTNGQIVIGGTSGPAVANISGTANEVEITNGDGTIAIGLPATVSGLTCVGATCLGGTLQTAAQANVTSVGTLSSLGITGALIVDTTSLTVDATNNRVGIGTATPSHLLDVDGVAHVATCVITPKICITSEYVLPAADGSAGQLMCTDGSGALAFATVASTSPGGSDTYIQFNDGGSFGGSANLTWDDSTFAVTGDITVADSSGILVGNSSRITVWSTAVENQILGAAYIDATQLIGRFAASTGGPQVNFVKSRNTTPGSYTTVQDDDQLGAILWNADDGTDYSSHAASIYAYVDGTPGTADMPGRLSFQTTADGSASPTERMRIDSAGQVTIKNTGNTGLIVDGSAQSTGVITQLQILDGDQNPATISSQQIGGKAVMGFIMGGSQRMQVDSDGYVGIGTTAPAAVLHVHGETRLSDGYALNWGGDQVKILGSHSTDSMALRTGNAAVLCLCSDQSLRIDHHVDIGSNVCIQGNTSPCVYVKCSQECSYIHLVFNGTLNTSNKYPVIGCTLGSWNFIGSNDCALTKYYASVTTKIIAPYATGECACLNFTMCNGCTCSCVPLKIFYWATCHNCIYASCICATTCIGAPTKNFEINHPCCDKDTPNKYNNMILVHGTTEGPEYGVYDRGTATLCNGIAIVEMPGYWEKLTHDDDRTIQLTPVGGWSPLVVKCRVTDGQFVVCTTEEGSQTQEFDWHVAARRDDEHIRTRHRDVPLGGADEDSKMIVEDWRRDFWEHNDETLLNFLTANELKNILYRNELDYTESWSKSQLVDKIVNTTGEWRNPGERPVFSEEDYIEPVDELAPKEEE